MFFFYVSFWIGFAYQKLNWIYLFVWKWKVWFKVLDSQLDILLARHYFAGLTSAFLLTLTLLWVESTKKMNLEGITGLIWRWQTVFGMIWMDFYLPTLQGRNVAGNCWKPQNSAVGFVWWHGDLPTNAVRAKIAVTNFDSGKGTYVVDHVFFRDISKIVPVAELRILFCNCTFFCLFVWIYVFCHIFFYSLCALIMFKH